MTLKGLCDGAFLAGLALIWIDAFQGRPASKFAIAAATIPVLVRTACAANQRKAPR